MKSGRSSPDPGVTLRPWEHPSHAVELGVIAGCLETLMVFKTGVMPPSHIALNFVFLVGALGGVAFAWIVVSRWPPLKRVPADSVLVLASVLLFALRGCLLDCGPDSTRRLVVLLVIVLGAWGLLAVLRRAYPGGASAWPILIGSVAMTLSAIDYAFRDGLVVGSEDWLSVPLSLAVPAVSGCLVVNRTWPARVAWALLFLTVSVSWAAYAGRPLSIEPAAKSPAPGTAPESRFPNVVVVVLDTVRADHLSLYGYPRRTSPNLDALAGESLVFDHAIASGNYSLPSHASLFTGLLPSQHGAHQRPGVGMAGATAGPSDRGLAEGIETLASRLQSRRFTTGGVSANYGYLTRWTGLQQGFDVFDDRPRILLGYHPYSFPLQRRVQLLRRRLGGRFDPSRSREEWDADTVTDAGLHFAAAAREPFLLFLNYMDAHDPYRSREGHLFRGDGLASDQRGRAAYDSEVAYVDQALGRLVRTLRDLSLLDQTVLVVVADHGEFFGEHGLTNHKVGAYEEVLHVPLLVRYPRALKPGRVEKSFGLHEVQKLIMDLVDSQPTDWLAEGGDEPRVLAQTWDSAGEADGADSGADIVYMGSFKLIVRRSGESEMYDLSTDPGEAHNLLVDPSAQVRAREVRMRRAVAGLPPAKEGTNPATTAADLTALRGLGYISLKKPPSR